MVLLVLWVFFPSGPTGYIHAFFDLAIGRPVIQQYGLTTTGPEVRAAFARYGIGFNNGFGCCASDLDRAYCESYNSVVRRVLRKRYGRDVISECWREGRAEEKREDAARIARYMREDAEMAHPR